MTRYDGRLMAAGRTAVTGGQALKKHTLATQVWCNDSIGASGSDVLYFGKLPKGAVVSGGRMYSARLASGSSAASCCLSLCLGVDAICFSASGTSYSIASLTSGFGLFSPIDFAILTSTSTYATSRFDSGFYAPLGGLLLTQGPLTLQGDGNVFATVMVSAQSGSGISGYLNLELDYYTGTFT